jgi:hypothetical protein
MGVIRLSVASSSYQIKLLGIFFAPLVCEGVLVLLSHVLQRPSA